MWYLFSLLWLYWPNIVKFDKKPKVNHDCMYIILSSLNGLNCIYIHIHVGGHYTTRPILSLLLCISSRTIPFSCCDVLPYNSIKYNRNFPMNWKIVAALLFDCTMIVLCDWACVVLIFLFPSVLCCLWRFLLQIFVSIGKVYCLYSFDKIIHSSSPEQELSMSFVEEVKI
jgi:hypothetical protein